MNRPSVWQADRAGFLRRSPSALFVFLSLLFGVAIAFLTPPLRGPDESAHFLRAYGISQGDIVPSRLDQEGRKGIFLPAHVYEGFAYFDALQIMPRGPTFSYRQAIEEYRISRTAKASEDAPPQPVFVRYGGSEGYSPAPYLPHIVAVGAARLLGLEFLGTLYLMRIIGLLASTAIIAYAIALAAPLRWPLLLIAMIPAALYGRAVINADGGVLAYSMVVTALWLRGTLFPQTRRVLAEAAWLCLCALSKPPQIIFVVLAAAAQPVRDIVRSWRGIAAVALPALILSIAWVLMSAGDVGAWRLVELTGIPAEQFSVGWKLRFMLQQPLHFPIALFGTVTQIGELWRQLIGVLGLFDVVLRLWVYPLLTFLLLISWATPVDLAPRIRQRLAVFAAITAVTYASAIFAIFYLVWTPVRADEIWGVQGRYFLPVLPLFAIAFACAVNRGSYRLAVSASALGAVISGLSSLEAILRVEWRW